EDVAVTDKLPGLSMGCGETETDENIVQTPFELCQEVFAGDTLLPHGFFEIRPELIFENAVDALHFLLFPELQPVADEFRLSVAAVLSRLKISLLDAAGWFKASLALQKKLYSFSAAQPADWSNISSQLNSPSLGRTATVVRNRSHVANGRHFESRRFQSPDRGIPSGAVGFHIDIESLNSGIARPV